MDQPLPGPEPPLGRLLLLASRWFEAECVAELERRGWPRLSPSQSAVFFYLEDAGVAPSELARRLGQTRQSTYELVNGLVRLGLLHMQDDPHRRGGRLVHATARGRRLVRDTDVVLGAIEAELGIRRVRSLRRLLVGLSAGPATAEITPTGQRDAPAVPPGH